MESARINPIENFCKNGGWVGRGGDMPINSCVQCRIQTELNVTIVDFTLMDV